MGGSIDTKGNVHWMWQDWPDGTKSGPGQFFQSPGNPDDITQPYKTLLAQAPKSSPDYTDRVVQAARAAEALSITAKQGRQSTFLTGASGLGASPPSVGTKTLLGG